MTSEDFFAIVTHTILDGQQRYIALWLKVKQEDWTVGEDPWRRRIFE